MRQTWIALLFLAGGLVAPTDAFACVCGAGATAPAPSELTRQVQRDMDAARAVFIGEPIAGNSLALRFRVQSVWKGELGQEVVMSTGAEPTADGLISSSSCDFSFRDGEVYVVFASGPSHTQMRAHSCTFTSLLEHSRVLGTLDGITRRRPPSPSVRTAQKVAVLGSVRNQGLFEWREGLTVADAIILAGGVVPPPRPEYAGLGSRVRRGRKGREELPAAASMLLLPDDEVFVAGPIRLPPVRPR
jgi:hypothetical protein